MKINKNILLIGTFILGIFFIPNDVFAETINIQYRDYISSLPVEEKDKIYNTIMSNEKILEIDVTSNITILDISNFSQNSSLGLDYYNQARYMFVNFSLTSSPRFTYFQDKPRIDFYAYYIYYFDENLQLLNIENNKNNRISGNCRLLSLESNVYYNPFIYCDCEVLNRYSSVVTFDFYSGSTFIKTISVNDNILELVSFTKPEIQFEINDIHEISKLILGEDIPEEFSFLYLVFDYLLVILFVIVVISPFVVISRLLRWS